MNSLQASVNSMVGPGMAHSAALRGDNGQIGVMARLAINEAINEKPRPNVKVNFADIVKEDRSKKETD